MKRQENRAVIAWRGAASAGLVSSADRAYMKAPVPHPTLRLVDKVSRSGAHTSGKIAGQRATVKAEMNGFTPGLDRRPLARLALLSPLFPNRQHPFLIKKDVIVFEIWRKAGFVIAGYVCLHTLSDFFTNRVWCLC